MRQTFFSMNNMFDWNPGPGQEIASPYLYVYFVVTVPVTLMVYFAWFGWFKFNKRRYNKHHEEGLQDIEKELRIRVRTATGTW